MQVSKHKENMWRYNQTANSNNGASSSCNKPLQLFPTINQLCIQRDQKQVEYHAVQQHSRNKEMCHYTNHIHWSSATTQSVHLYLTIQFKIFAAMSVISGSGWNWHYDTHTNKIKPIKDNLWPHSEHLAMHGRCSLCIGCVTVSPNIVNVCSASAQSMSKTHWWMKGGGGGAVDVVLLSKNWKTAFTCTDQWQLHRAEQSSMANFASKFGSGQRNTVSSCFHLANSETGPGFECNNIYYITRP